MALALIILIGVVNTIIVIRFIINFIKGFKKGLEIGKVIRNFNEQMN